MADTIDDQQPNDRGSNAPHCSAFEFDDHPDRLGFVEVRDYSGSMILVVGVAGEEHVLIKTMRDQWGVFIAIGDKLCVAQEDGTRAFMDALSQGLQALRKATEAGTTEAT